MDEKTAQRIGLLTVFLICKPCLCQSVADPWHRTVKDKRDATRTSRMGLRTIRTLADEIWKSYGYYVHMNFPEKSSMFDFYLPPGFSLGGRL